MSPKLQWRLGDIRDVRRVRHPLRKAAGIKWSKREITVVKDSRDGRKGLPECRCRHPMDGAPSPSKKEKGEDYLRAAITIFSVSWST